MFNRRQFIRMAGCSAGIGLLGAGDALGLEPRLALIVQNWNVEHIHWRSDRRPLRIGILTDIHVCEPWMPLSRVRKIVRRLNDEKPDIIFLLGDYVNALRKAYYIETIAPSEWAVELQGLNAPHGVFAVLGNHDWWTGEVPAIRQAFAKSDIVLLENESVALRHDNQSFWVAGLGDQLVHHYAGVDDLPKTLKQIKDNAPIILLAHEPDIFTHVPDRVALTLCGHTHGGQVYIPFIGRPALKAYKDDKANFAYGHVKRSQRHMIVSSGLGLSNYPIRFLVPPEIAIVTLSGIGA